ncbi:hypothetical protein HPP92_012448 [Vanilla planifolia]|uniref:Exocyst component Exo84 C-terminal domain-containing protein n=1 Tax=Vanilla planifolia TaxID=51239 RepID=A0A835UVU3_VANPL|nr:hypothetical protein HPP92_012448 [Vanilla planifolia]
MDCVSLTAQFDDLEVGEDQSSEDGMEEVSDSESEGYELEPESMTGKGIKRLCSELLELKKVSDEDFQRNIYSNYSAFLRIFEEVEGIEREIMQMKKHVSTQRMLLEELMSGVHVDINFDNIEHAEDESIEDLELDFPTWLESRTQNILETMDTLLSECRMEEALLVLEKETKVLQKLQKEKGCLLTIISPFASAILDCRSMLVERFTSVAEHRRVTMPELHNALLGLCRLGEAHQASILLLNFFRLKLETSANELKRFEPFAHGSHILQLFKLVFSTVHQAARSFVILFGDSSPHASGLLQWATVELEVICHSFHAYIQSNTDTIFNLGLTVEIVGSCFFFVSLLEKEGFMLQPDLMKLMKPCILEVLQIQVDHLRKVIILSTKIDNWTLYKYFISRISGDKSSLPEKNQQLGYCQLTISGKKFITLMQMFLTDGFLLHAFHVESFVLKGLADLFGEYTMALETAMTVREHVEESDVMQIISAQGLQQQISILVNLSALVQLLSTVVNNSLNATMVSSSMLLPEQAELSSKKEPDTWKLSIQQASDRLRNYFCMQFLSGIINHGDYELIKSLDTCSCGHCITGSSDALMPSFAFQELFLRLRQLEEHCKCKFLIEDGILNGLNSEIIKMTILWLSESWQFFKNTRSHIQLLLDVHFLIEIARLEVQDPNDLMVEALDLAANMSLELSKKHPKSEFPDEVLAANAAKAAIKTILETEVAEPDEDCSNPVICTTYIEDEQAAAGADTSNDRLNETIFTDNLYVEDSTNILAEESGWNLDLLKADSELETGEYLKNIESVGSLERQDGNVNVVNLSNSYEAFAQVDCFSFETLVDGPLPAPRIIGLVSCTNETDACLSATDGQSSNDDKICMLDSQHSNENPSNAVEFENDGTQGMDSSGEKISGDQGRGDHYLKYPSERKERPKHGGSTERFKPRKASEKLKHGQAVDSSGKNRKGKTTRPLWQ